MHSQRPLLDTRRAVRRALAGLFAENTPRAEETPAPLVLVALSGGADSLALAAALAAEAVTEAALAAKGSVAKASAAGPRPAKLRAGALIVDHGLQSGSAGVAERAAEQARELGLDPVLVRRVAVPSGRGAAGGPESLARDARYAAFLAVAMETGAAAILTAHTRTDQAEQVLLGIARGSGTRALAGIPHQRVLGDGSLILRPFLAAEPAITRADTEAACESQGLRPWQDPHNLDPSFARVRVRERVLPMLERELGPGIAAALARTADQASEDADALDALAAQAEAGVRVQEADKTEAAVGARRVILDAAALAGLPAAIRGRVIRRVAASDFGAHLSREHTLAIAALVTHWRGQGSVFVPQIRVTRVRGGLLLEQQTGSPRATAGAGPKPPSAAD